MPAANRNTLEKRKELTDGKLKDAIARQNYLQMHYERAANLLSRVEDLH